MSQDSNRDLIPSDGGVLNDLSKRVKLILRLMGDSRVNPLLKVLPIGSLLYFLIPDIVVGPLDDVAIIWLGTYLFVELCPPHIVEEHMASLGGQSLPGQGFEPPRSQEDIIEGEFWEDRR